MEVAESITVVLVVVITHVVLIPGLVLINVLPMIAAAVVVVLLNKADGVIQLVDVTCHLE